VAFADAGLLRAAHRDLGNHHVNHVVVDAYGAGFYAPGDSKVVYVKALNPGSSE